MLHYFLLLVAHDLILLFNIIHSIIDFDRLPLLLTN